MVDKAKAAMPGREGAATPAKPAQAGAAQRFAEAVRRAETGAHAPQGERQAPASGSAPARGGSLAPGKEHPSGRVPAEGARAKAEETKRQADARKSEEPVVAARTDRMRETDHEADTALFVKDERGDAGSAGEQELRLPPRQATPHAASLGMPPTSAIPSALHSASADVGVPQGSASAAASMASEMHAPGAAAAPGLAAADALMPKLAPRMPARFTLTFPPNAWPLLRAEGSRGPNGLNLKLTAADAKDEARLKSAVASLKEALESAGHVVGAITVQTDGE